MYCVLKFYGTYSLVSDSIRIKGLERSVIRSEGARFCRLTAVRLVHHAVLVDVVPDDLVLGVHNSVPVGVAGHAGVGVVYHAVAVGVTHYTGVGRVDHSVAVDVCGREASRPGLRLKGIPVG